MKTTQIILNYILGFIIGNISISIWISQDEAYISCIPAAMIVIAVKLNLKDNS